MRVIFALHATIAIIRITITQGDYWYLLNMCGVNFLLIELVVTVIKRKGWTISPPPLITLSFSFQAENQNGETSNAGSRWSIVFCSGFHRVSFSTFAR